MANPASITLEQLFRYNKGLPHQLAAISQLEQALLSGKAYGEVMRRDTDWFHTWSQDGKQPDPEQQNHANPLPVPYEYQLDNLSGTGYRECFSSSCAMIAKFYGKVKNDDEYNKIRSKYGDSTDSSAQLSALRFLGLQANFRSNGSSAKLKALLAEGVPVPVGWLHKGPISRPSGGGHWACIIGLTDRAWIVHDPNGEADLISGGYPGRTSGAAVHYSFKNFNPRWECDGGGTGWYMEIRK